MLGIRTRGCNMVGADETTELWGATHYLIMLSSIDGQSRIRSESKWQNGFLKYNFENRILNRPIR